MNSRTGLRWVVAAGKCRPIVRSRFDETNVVEAFALDPSNEDVVGLPRYFPLRLPASKVVRDVRDDGLPVSAEARFEGVLRPHQRFVVDAFDGDHGVVVLGCGKGKTATAIYLAIEVFRRRTLYVVHREPLFDQVRRELARFAPNARVGTIRQNRVDAGDDKDVVVAMLQSLCMHEYDADVYRGYGVVVVDEAHHICSTVFSRLLPMLPARIRIGLSATPERADGMTPLLRWHIGDDVNLKPEAGGESPAPRRKRLAVMFRLDYDGTKLGDEPARATPRSHAAKMAQRSVLLKRMMACAYRERFVEKSLRSLYDDRSRGRNVVAFTHQVDHVHRMHRALCQRRPSAASDAAKYFGALKREARDAATQRRVIVSTYQMASEGFDLPRLDTLFLATPARSDVTQILGRIERDHPNKAPLLVYDLWDDIGPFARSGWARRRTYEAHGFVVAIESVRLAPAAE